MSLQMESIGTEQHETTIGGGSTSVGGSTNGGGSADGGVAAENQSNGAASGRVVSNEAPPAEVNGASQSDVAAEVNLGADNEHDWMVPPPSAPATAHVVARDPTPAHATAPAPVPVPVPAPAGKGKGAPAAKGKGKVVATSQPPPSSSPIKSKSKMGASSQPAPTINAQRPNRVMQSRYMKPFAAAPAAASQNNAATEMEKEQHLQHIKERHYKFQDRRERHQVSQIPHVFPETARTRKLVKVWSDVTDSFNEVKKRRLEGCGSIPSEGNAEKK
ncbi:hypothetical protein RIF29_14839 [Crotalaria pallida]|uniref:Uncharacterized protein n=1 Tax=Crotalaria pallida TaxID=3830 RepID=A0AAN9IIP3_CROPI